MNRQDMWRQRLNGYTYEQIAEGAGITRQRVQQILSPPKAIRDHIIKKYDGCCVDCSIRVGKSGHVHHVNTDIEDYGDIENLVLLCISCHRKRHREYQLVESQPVLHMPTLKCLRCGHKWHPRTDKLPAVCPNLKCKSPYWNKPRRRDLNK